MIEAGASRTDVEKQTLMAFLNAQREAVLAIVDGLDDDSLRTPVVPSGWSPIGLLRHLGGAEMYWFQIVLAGHVPEPAADLGEKGGQAGEARGPFTTDEAPQEVVEAYRAQCRLSEEVLADFDLNSAPVGPIDADMAELCLDERTGLGPR